jgi:hypothetical protein
LEHGPVLRGGIEVGSDSPELAGPLSLRREDCL